MRRTYLIPTFAAGLALGFAAAFHFVGKATVVEASGTDRHQDYVMATGAVSLNARTQLDGVWMLDYRAGKLLGGCVDKTQGKMMPWAEVDLVSEFQVAPKQDVHFMMTSGYLAPGQSALYVAETVTGKFGVYTMAAGPNGQGVIIRRHDLTNFRKLVDASGQPATPIEPPPATLPNPIGATPSMPVPGAGATPLLPASAAPTPAPIVPAPVVVPPPVK